MKVFPRAELPRSYKDELQELNGEVHMNNTKPDIIEENKEGEYHITTFGAPAAHTLKFKQGGLRHGEEKLAEKQKQLKTLLKSKRNDKETTGYLLSLDVFEAQMQLARRRDICYCQILPAITTSFVKILQLNRSKPHVLKQYAEVGFLCQFESLVSTHGSEIGMLADYDGSVRGIASQVSFVLCDEGEDLQMEFLEKNDDDLQPPLSPSPLSSDEFNLITAPQSFYDRCHLRITLPIPSDLLKDVSGTIQGPVQVHPLLFSQGINEQQSIANKIGDTSLQENINKENGVLLKKYYQSYEDWCNSNHIPLNPKISSDLNSILSTIKHSKREKNLQILATTADIVRMMNGGRLTSCKSAKDRTSMSVTWEQARQLANHHNLHYDAFRDAMSVMRSSGVRRENAFKNIGKNKFAFNSFQLKMIPEIYRAPKGSGGAEVT
uniref:Uncharacterized protein n=1 Tax=Paramoeba aestuarina TaxID=180227 RepID=A0A7S4NVV8_9EUKA|eukprot:CAMPEP_0201518316 /NCGR_PEP_ID=MMETSP0161_2-20130828/9202_1 /ASSEMBLY_ACC=CAM_ASM_000251 /TAXON_ID=180227 /ORGANISM="Neoparamoeba aestuarina, Strain SoJaBio B1-5/56/2" /LENGTH=435 /DNA_ID=CAMNT_0047916065 /DNA_START=110 /DNA_END=1417 /DNA_ORIENTATION=+